MLKLCNKDAVAYSFEGPPDTEPPLFSMPDSSHQPPWSSEQAKEQIPMPACPLQSQLDTGMEETEVLLQATNEIGGSGLKEISHKQYPLCLAWEMGIWASTSPVSPHDGVFCGSSMTRTKTWATRPYLAGKAWYLHTSLYISCNLG